VQSRPNFWVWQVGQQRELAADIQMCPCPFILFPSKSCQLWEKAIYKLLQVLGFPVMLRYALLSEQVDAARVPKRGPTRCAWHQVSTDCH
jgi:hypothetical protein